MDDRSNLARPGSRLIVHLVLLLGLAVLAVAGLPRVMRRPRRASAEPALQDEGDRPARRIRRGWAQPLAGEPETRAPASAREAQPEEQAPPEEAVAQPENPSTEAAPPSPPPPRKRVVVTPAELAADRTRIALAQLAPRQEELARSGATAGPAAPWQDRASGVRSELSRSLIANAGIRISEATCFRAGCSFSVDAANDAASVQAIGRLRMLLRGEMPNPFSGESFVSGLETRPDASLRTTVILYGPGHAQDTRSPRP